MFSSTHMHLIRSVILHLFLLTGVFASIPLGSPSEPDITSLVSRILEALNATHIPTPSPGYDIESEEVAKYFAWTDSNFADSKPFEYVANWSKTLAGRIPDGMSEPTFFVRYHMVR